MALASGTRLGPYEIVTLLGAGGMGEVYRARDTRLGRDVAVKVMPRGMADDPERQKRFEAEARAAGTLNHPNIVTLHDVGVADGVPYLVTEVLEGESLRDLLHRGPVAPARAIDLVVQLSNGLTVAHTKGIVHRDLKPENLFILSDGRLKILDFGIAKLTRTESTASEAETTPVFASLTAAGTIMGTVSYMAPEQLRDRPVDQRADLFAVGAIFYELLTGKQPFTGETAADRVSSILMAEPPALPDHVEKEVPGLGAIVAHLLTKRPEGRFDSASDLAFTLTLLKGRPAPAAPAGSDAGRAPAAASQIDFRQLTFREGDIGNARFAPDGQTVIYDAAWGGGQREIYLTRIESPESTSLGIPDADLQAVSSSAEVAVTLRPKDVGGFIRLGTLARFPLMGGRPREIVDSVFMADWAPDGRSLAALRQVGSDFQLEAPLGHVVHRSNGWMSHVRYSPDGSTIAFLEHPALGDNAGHVCVVRPGEPARRLTEHFMMVWRVAWRPDGGEIWFGGQERENFTGVFSVDLEGRCRRFFSAPGWPTIDDVSRSGDALIGMVNPRMKLETGLRTGGPDSIRDLSWLDWTLLRDISADGSNVIFDETGPGSAGMPGIFIRPTDGGPAVRLADGICSKISPNGKLVLGMQQGERNILQVVPTGAGALRRVDLGEHLLSFADWASDIAVVLLASKADSPRRLYRLDLASGAIAPINDQFGVAGSSVVVSRDGAKIACRTSSNEFAIVDTATGAVRAIPGQDPSERPCGWASDSKHLFTFATGTIPCLVRRYDVETLAAEPWMEIRPTVRSGVSGINSVRLSGDGERYACSYPIIDSTLFLARGVQSPPR